MILRFAFALLSLAAAAGLLAQGPRAFEVASIKVHRGPFTQNGTSVSGTRYSVYAMTLRQILSTVYGVQDLQLSFASGVNPADDVRYDMEAKAGGDAPATASQFRQMLQTLLADRFKLTLHRETKQVSGYALVVEKGGPKFHESALDADDSFNGSRTSGTHAILQTVKYSMDELASRLASTYLGNRPVENKTGLTGAYEFS